jgi:hypothetical protein
MAEGSGVRWLLVSGLGLVLLAVVGALLYGWWVRPAVPPPAAQVAVGGVTARQAFTPAAELAGQWQEDARLAAVSGRWSAADMQVGGQVEWAFQFFSPVTQRLALIAVAAGTARMVRESLSPYVVPTFSAAEWRVDSDRALQAWWERGGKVLIARRPDAELALQLHVPGAGGQPVWTVVGLIAGTDTAFTVVVNATAGTLIEP